MLPSYFDMPNIHIPKPSNATLGLWTLNLIYWGNWLWFWHHIGKLNAHTDDRELRDLAYVTFSLFALLIVRIIYWWRLAQITRRPSKALLVLRILGALILGAVVGILAVLLTS